MQLIKLFPGLFLLIMIFWLPMVSHAVTNTIGSRLAGKILLQVESHGEAWYVEPMTTHRYLLGHPTGAFTVMRSLGVGISNKDIQKISVATGYGATQQTQTDNILAKRLSGTILLQVENNGEAWYVNPSDLKRYYLGRPADALVVMRTVGLGITNTNLAKIVESPFSASKWMRYSNSQYQFSYDYPIGDYRMGGNDQYAFVAGEWYTAHHGVSKSFCQSFECQDPPIHFSAIDGTTLDEIFAKFQDSNLSGFDVKDSFFQNSYKAKILTKPGYTKTIIFARGSVVFILTGKDDSIFERMIDTFRPSA